MCVRTQRCRRGGKVYGEKGECRSTRRVWSRNRRVRCRGVLKDPRRGLQATAGEKVLAFLGWPLEKEGFRNPLVR